MLPDGRRAKGERNETQGDAPIREGCRPAACQRAATRQWRAGERVQFVVHREVTDQRGRRIHG